MNNDTIQGNWNILKGKIKQVWGDLSDDEIATFNGKRDEFYGHVQRKYGLARDAVDEYMDKINDKNAAA